MWHSTKRLGLAVCLLLVGASALAQTSALNFRIVSDIDDTAKIINVGKAWDAVRNGLFSRKTFAGMAELYQALDRSAGATSGTPALSWVSGSPTFLKARLRKVLEKYQGFPKADFYLRSPLKDRNIVIFKGQKLLRLSLMSQDSFVLLGDDTQSDPEIYESFTGVVGASRILAKYIRVVRNRALPAGVKPFHSALDVALEEFEAGRVTEQEAVLVGERIIATAKVKPELVFPKFVFCPTEGILPVAGPKQQSSAALMGLRLEYTSVVHEVCKQRQESLSESERLKLLEAVQAASSDLLIGDPAPQLVEAVQ